MLLFTPEHVGPILAGTKTQTRRIWKKKRANVGSTHLAKTRMISKEYFAKLEILAVYQEHILNISEEDSIAEGYPSKHAYLVAFCRIGKLQYAELENIVAWVVKFRVVV
jgi:hypothetical protein